MRRIALLLAMVAAIVMVVSASPAWAHDRDDHDFCDHHNCDREDFCDHHDCDFDVDVLDVDDVFFGFPFVSVIDDVDVENVGERNPLEGECIPTDVDLDGFIAEWEVECFV